MPCFYLTPKQDDFNQELQICIAEALYDVDSIVADPGAYIKEELIILLTAPIFVTVAPHHNPQDTRIEFRSWSTWILYRGPCI